MRHAVKNEDLIKLQRKAILIDILGYLTCFAIGGAIGTIVAFAI